MATEQVRMCDHCKPKRVIATEPPLTLTVHVEGEPPADCKLDLCKSHRERLERFVHRGTTAPEPKKVAESV